ncbi:hypothetical protein [Vagococcus hydrophili]|uniref:Uncharacterized protein n=1 Tax=Vagococcus hydrophili TaxID=2714947 RepID=A0A6G8AQT3_9ENTE|nr:hypothetical protein [Vagococcus hydrophili]QIL47329.1 hypothetical protein G7082_01680 [Vagococcus hydrophili]
MARKKISILAATNDLLTTALYIEKGTLIAVYNNTERKVFADVDFFELVYNGEDLYLNFSTVGTENTYNERINLSTVNNINGVLINPSN